MNLPSPLIFVESEPHALPPPPCGGVWTPSQVIGLFDTLFTVSPVDGPALWYRLSKHGEPSRTLIVSGPQRITTIFKTLRGRAPLFPAGKTHLNRPLFCHLESEQFAVLDATTVGDPFWANIATFFGSGDPDAGTSITVIHPIQQLGA